MNIGNGNEFSRILIFCQFWRFHAEKVKKYVFMQQVFIKLYTKMAFTIIALHFALNHTGEHQTPEGLIGDLHPKIRCLP